MSQTWLELEFIIALLRVWTCPDVHVFVKSDVSNSSQVAQYSLSWLFF